MPNLCINCKYHKLVDYSVLPHKHSCLHEEFVDIVTGESPSCESVRADQRKCGTFGSGYEEKPK